MAASAALLMPGGARADTELVVSAAASLSNAFSDIGRDFEKDNSGIRVIFNFGSSGALYQQVEKGAPVDVFASADKETMDKAVTKGLVDAASRRDFASNRLVLVAPAKSSLNIKGIKDLKAKDVKRVAIGSPGTVPAGRYAKQALGKERLWDALEPKFIYTNTVRQVLDYVARGEVDAGFVYATDAEAAGDRVKVVAEAGGHEPIVYPAAAVSSGRQARSAHKFLGYLLGRKGQAALSRHGFGRP